MDKIQQKVVVNVQQSTVELEKALEGTFVGKEGSHKVTDLSLKKQKAELLAKYTEAGVTKVADLPKLLEERKVTHESLEKQREAKFLENYQPSKLWSSFTYQEIDIAAREAAGRGDNQWSKEYVQLLDSTREAKISITKLERDIESIESLETEQKHLLEEQKGVSAKLNQAVSEYTSAINELIEAQKKKYEPSEMEFVSAQGPAVPRAVLSAQAKIESKREAVDKALDEVYKGLDLKEMAAQIEGWEAQVDSFKKELEGLSTSSSSNFSSSNLNTFINYYENKIKATKDQMEVFLRYGTAINAEGSDLSEEDKQNVGHRNNVIFQINKEGVSNEQIKDIRKNLESMKFEGKPSNEKQEACEAILKTMTILKDVDDLLAGKEGLEQFQEANAKTMEKWLPIINFLNILVITSPIASLIEAWLNQGVGEADVTLQAINDKLAEFKKIS